MVNTKIKESEHGYNHIEVEERWARFWKEIDLHQATSNPENLSPENKMYLLFAFAYPSGSGLHVGHVESMAALDILARYYRMNGKNVFFPVGWDSFGLPAENYAIKTGVPPAVTTYDAIATFEQQIEKLGISYDWETDLATSDPEYYKWTQWIFQQMYQQEVAYKAEAAVNWCPSCQTVLANEQVINGTCDRCDSPVEQKEMSQWFYRITDYADRLIDDLDDVSWPESTAKQQRDWVGRKEGANVGFFVDGYDIQLDCFTTRLDTLFGVTYLVISPEKFNEFELDSIANPEQIEKINKYLEQARLKTEEDRKKGEKDKTGVDTGIFVTNPANGEKVPLYIADYVLGGYGTGVVMGVPAHDERDYAFAEKFGIEIVQVIEDMESGDAVHSNKGKLINSGPYSGMTSDEAIAKLLEDYPDVLSKETNYRLRDWLISRQRYWGVPIPIVYDPDGNEHLIPDEHLPWLLPEDVDFKPTGESPLRGSKELKDRVEKIFGKGWTPEFDTMDTFVDSSWYYLRYLDARNNENLANPKQIDSWMPVDFYLIGKEHAILHLLYSRFFTKFLYDQGIVKVEEPFPNMEHQGMILAYAYETQGGRKIANDLVGQRDNGEYFHIETEEKLSQVVAKMSKNRKNVVNPDEVISEYGADSLRMYEMFMGPIDVDKPWDDTQIIGVRRFLDKVYSLVSSHLSVAEVLEGNEQVSNELARTIQKVTEDIPELKFNTAIAAMMGFAKSWEKASRELQDIATLSRDQVISFVQILSPFAPFLAAELYSQLLGDEAAIVDLTDWPEVEGAVEEATFTLPMQINGKVRETIQIETAIKDDEDAVKELVLSHEGIVSRVGDKQVVRVIYVPGKIINVIAK